MKPIDSFNKVLFQYDSGKIPPPFCHRYHLEIKVDSPANSHVDLNLEYYNRDEISEEAIIEEGFSMEDDFRWKGRIPEIWVIELIKKINSTNWMKNPSKNLHSPDLRIKISQDEKSEMLSPANARQWEIFVQEIIQAIFELAKREAPLHITFVSKPKQDLVHKVDIVYSFAQRNLRIESKNKSIMTLNWEEGQKLLKYIFEIDYLPENSLEKVPKSHGDYISPGDGCWYELAPEKEKRKDEAGKTKKLIETLTSYA